MAQNSPSQHTSSQISPSKSSSSINASYSQVTKAKITPLTTFKHPTEEQGIVFNCISDYKLCDYLIAVMNLVGGPLNIIAASKVSRNRIIIHLKDSSLVDSFMADHGGFKIEDNFIKCRRQKTPAKRIIFSNVPPTLPNEVLQDYVVNQLKLDITSDIAILRVNPYHQLFGHIISWRRQVYTTTNIEEANLPGSFVLDHANVSHRIFITFDEFTCFKCKVKGHRAEDCPVEIETFTNDEQLEENALVTQPGNPEKNEIDHFPPLPPKRPLPSTSSSSVSTSTLMEIDAPASQEVNERRKKKQAKKQKIKHSDELPGQAEVSETDSGTETEEPSSTLREILKPHEVTINKKFKTNEFPLSATNFALFVDMSKGKTALEIQSILTDEFKVSSESTIRMLTELHSVIKDRSTKVHLTKIQNKLKGLTPSDTGTQPQV